MGHIWVDPGIWGANVAHSLPPLDFTSNGVFYGTSEEEFGLHVTRLTPILPQNLNSTAQQVSVKEDDGARLVASRGLVFVSGLRGHYILELGEAPCIAKVVIPLLPLLTK